MITRAVRYLTLTEVLTLHDRLIEQTGGASGIRDLGALEAAVAQPKQTFDGVDLYESVLQKAATMGFGLLQNHPFVDGNKRVAHAAMEVFLLLNGYSLTATVDDAERVILGVAAGTLDRAALHAWLEASAARL
jgi:death-on-curing protein